MVVIRLSRVGAKKRPFYHVVVTDSRRRRDGNYVENIGYFNPVARGQEVRLHLDMADISCSRFRFLCCSGSINPR